MIMLTTMMMMRKKEQRYDNDDDEDNDDDDDDDDDTDNDDNDVFLHRISEGAKPKATDSLTHVPIKYKDLLICPKLSDWEHGSKTCFMRFRFQNMLNVASPPSAAMHRSPSQRALRELGGYVDVRNCSSSKLG